MAAKGEQAVTKDARGRVVNVKLDNQVLDPQSPEAVQVPVSQLDENPVEVFSEESLEPKLNDTVPVGDKTEEQLDTAARTHDGVALGAGRALDSGVEVGEPSGALADATAEAQARQERDAEARADREAEVEAQRAEAEDNEQPAEE